MKKLFLFGLCAVSFAWQASADTIADWTFETTAPTTAGPISPETGSGSASGSHAGAAVYSSPVGNGSAKSYSANTWAVNDYWQFQVSATGYQGIMLSYDQNGSGTGPGTFQLEYSTDGTDFTAFGSAYTLTSGVTWATGTPNQATHESFDLSAITALNNASVVDFRLIDTSTVSVAGGTVGSGGTDRVDNVDITATLVPEPSSLAVVGLGGAVASFFAFRRRKV
jgi:PEP-CTERM motif